MDAAGATRMSPGADGGELPLDLVDNSGHVIGNPYRRMRSFPSGYCNAGGQAFRFGFPFARQRGKGTLAFRTLQAGPPRSRSSGELLRRAVAGAPTP